MNNQHLNKTFVNAQNSQTPSILAKAAYDINMYAQSIYDFWNTEYNFHNYYYDETKNIQLCYLKLNYCIMLLNFVCQLGEGYNRTKFLYLIRYFYDVNTDIDKGELVGYIPETLEDLPISKEESQLNKELVQKFKDLAFSRYDFCELSGICCKYRKYISQENDLDSITAVMTEIAQELVNKAYLRLEKFSDKDTIICYDYWQGVSDNHWKTKYISEYEAWLKGILKKNREKEIQSKYLEYIQSVFDSGFLNELIPTLHYTTDDKCDTFEINGSNYRLGEGQKYYPTDQNSQIKAGSWEQILAQHAIRELLDRNGEPDMDSIGRYLLTQRKSIGYYAIESFFAFLTIKSHIEEAQRIEENFWCLMRACVIAANDEGDSPTTSHHPAMWRPQDDAQKEVCRRLVEKKYCHAMGDHYEWDGTAEEFGFLIYHGTKKFKIGLHPSSGRIQWDMFCPFFSIGVKKKKLAQNAVTKLTHNDIKKGSSMYEKAERIRILLK